MLLYEYIPDASVRLLSSPYWNGLYLAGNLWKIPLQIPRISPKNQCSSGKRKLVSWGRVSCSDLSNYFLKLISRTPVNLKTSSCLEEKGKKRNSISEVKSYCCWTSSNSETEKPRGWSWKNIVAFPEHAWSSEIVFEGKNSSE